MVRQPIAKLTGVERREPRLELRLNKAGIGCR
jgi:hypothetical protein